MSGDGFGACIKYVPGEIVSLRSRPVVSDASPNVAVASRGRDAALLDNAEFYLGKITLQLHAVVPGTEIWQLGAMQRADPEAIFSLNFLGNSAGWLFGRDLKQSAASNSGRLFHDGTDGTVKEGWFAGYSTGCLLVVDISKDHCSEVMLAAAQGIRSITADGGQLSILGVYLTKSGRSLATVHEYMMLLLTAVETAPLPVIAVNMSVDFGQACGQSDAHVQGASTVSLSFPIFERALAEARAAASRTELVPAFFAAAGNQLRGGKPGWRLAYPAVRSEVIAVTSAGPCAGGMQLSVNVDYPAVHEFKPCFAVSEEDVGRGGVKQPGTTSMASGWAAGRYSALAIENDSAELRAAPPLAKVAQLQAWSRREFLLGGQNFWGRPGVHPMPGMKKLVQRGTLELLLQRLNQKFPGNEFFITGSLAALAALLKQYSDLEWAALRSVSVACGDVDLVSAVPLQSEDAVQCRKFAAEWLATWSLFDHSVDLAHRDASVALPTLSQAIIPAAQLAVTQDGIVDGHGGLKDIGDRKLRILVPEEAVWDTNPAYRAGAAGCALGILVWINTSLVLDVASAQLRKAVGANSLPGELMGNVFFDTADLPALEAKIAMNDVTPVSPSILAVRQRKLRPRLERTFALSRFAESFGLNVEPRRRLAASIEQAFFSGISMEQER